MKDIFQTFSNAVSPYLLYIKIVVIISLIIGSYFKGVHDERASWQLKEKDIQVKTAIVKEKRATVTAKSAAKSAQNRKKIQDQTRLDNINAYLSKKDVDSCVIPDGFIRLHNESAEGRVSNTAGESDGETEREPGEITK